MQPMELFDAMAALSADRGWPVEVVSEMAMVAQAPLDEALLVALGMTQLRGVTIGAAGDPARRVQILDELPAGERVLTLAHELGHVWYAADGHVHPGEDPADELAVETGAGVILTVFGVPVPAVHAELAGQYSAQLGVHAARAARARGAELGLTLVSALHARAQRVQRARCIMEVRPGQHRATIAQAMAHNTSTVDRDLDMLTALLRSRGDAEGLARVSDAQADIHRAYGTLLALFEEYVVEQEAAGDFDHAHPGTERVGVFDEATGTWLTPVDVADRLTEVAHHDATLARRYETR